WRLADDAARHAQRRPELCGADARRHPGCGRGRAGRGWGQPFHPLAGRRDMTHSDAQADPTPADIIHFWIDETGPKGWYQQSDDLARLVRDRFMAAWIDAPRLAEAWAGSATGALAALILTDQFPRNMFRDDARAF